MPTRSITLRSLSLWSRPTARGALASIGRSLRRRRWLDRGAVRRRYERTGPECGHLPRDTGGFIRTGQLQRAVVVCDIRRLWCFARALVKDLNARQPGDG